ncbi:MAG: HEAT repeat domain-containing protein [Planctomycetaceae bacterium]
MRSRAFVPCSALLAAAFLWPAVSAVAQPKQRAADDNRRLVRQLKRRIAELEKENAGLKEKLESVPAGLAGRKILTLLDSMYCGARYYSSSQPRFFVARLLVVNLSPQTISLKRDGVQLLVDGKRRNVEDVPANLKSTSYYMGSQSQSLRSVKPITQLTVKSGRTATTWVFFSNVSKRKDVPRLQLRMRFGKQTVALDVNRFARERLGMKVERIGPRGSLGLITISGSLNSVNVGSLVDAIDELTKKKVVRVVIRWTKSAGDIDSYIRNWIANAANYAGRNVNNYNSYAFPDIPVTVRELHLAQIPGSGSTSYGSSRGAPRIHKRDTDAVSAALKSAYESLPSDELLREIEHGHPLTRAAALANGGGRLPADKLPLILKFAEDKDLPLKLAALTALRHFGEKPAIDKLVAAAHSKDVRVSRNAIASLASSRFAVAHRKLLAILKAEPAESKKRIVKILAAYPRPLWSQTIYEFVKDPESKVGAEALRALGAIGHAKLVDVLENAVNSDDAAMRKEAFRQLLVRRDDRSEKIAMACTLKHMQKSLPTSQMYQLIRRTKDRRVIPLLLKHLEKSTSSNSTVIETLAQIGDQTVGAKLVKLYPKRKSEYDKSQILRALVKLKSPDFRKLAGDALKSRNSSLISAACEGLRADAGPAAVKMLIDTLEKSTYSSAWSYTSSALAQVATPEARQALLRARDSKNSSKKNYAINALRSLMQRSPGYQYVYRGRESLKRNKPKEAIQFYTLALKMDAQLAAAIAGRGHAYLRQNKISAARKDFDKAVKMDPYDAQAQTGVAIVLARQGKYEDAVKHLETQSKQFKSDRGFQYNAARVYSRALEAVTKAKTAPDRQKKIALFRSKAIGELKAVVKKTRGYSSGYKPADVKAEPDFAPLRSLPGYKQIIGEATGKKKAKTPAAKEDAGSATKVEKR